MHFVPLGANVYNFFTNLMISMNNSLRIATKYANVAKSVTLVILLSNKFVYFVALCEPLVMNIIMLLKKS